MFKAYRFNNVLTYIVKWQLQTRYYQNPFLLACIFAKLTSNELHVLLRSTSVLCMELIYMITKGQYPMLTCLWFTYPVSHPHDYPLTHSLCEFSFGSFWIVLRVCVSVCVCPFVPQPFHFVLFAPGSYNQKGFIFRLQSYSTVYPCTHFLHLLIY